MDCSENNTGGSGGHIDFGSIVYCLIGVLEPCRNWAELLEHSHQVWKIDIHCTSNNSSPFLKNNLAFLKKCFFDNMIAGFSDVFGKIQINMGKFIFCSYLVKSHPP